MVMFFPADFARLGLLSRADDDLGWTRSGPIHLSIFYAHLFRVPHRHICRVRDDQRVAKHSRADHHVLRRLFGGHVHWALHDPADNSHAQGILHHTWYIDLSQCWSFKSSTNIYELFVSCGRPLCLSLHVHMAQRHEFRHLVDLQVNLALSCTRTLIVWTNFYSPTNAAKPEAVSFWMTTVVDGQKQGGGDAFPQTLESHHEDSDSDEYVSRVQKPN